MSEAEGSQPRRSQRERKKAAHFVSVDSSLIKRKRSEDVSDDDQSSDLTELEDDDSSPEDADAEGEGEEFVASKAKPKTQRKGKASAKDSTGPPPAKKVRVAKTTRPKKTTLPKVPKAPGAKRGRKPKAAAATNGVEFNAEQVAKDTKISSDNALFNAIMNPSAALQSTAEDFLESLDATPGPSQAELINCILRACGCNDTVNQDEVVDYDGVVDALDNFTEALKQEDSPVYPLTSKLPAFKKFRKSLSEFLSRLISSAAALGQLYTSDLLPTLQTWVVAMSSSQLRAFRHTATVVALEVETALCEVAAEVEKEAEVVSRQREGERKRRKNKSDPPSAREKELEKKAAEVRERRGKLAEFLKEFVDGVFVHRYRDLDPNIRAECVRSMGLWFAKYPSHFLDGAYLRYVGWVLSDTNTHVRLEAVKSLSLAYAQTEYVGISALQHFTERFKPRLVEMAMGDTELNVRVAVVQVLQAINEHGLLEDEQTEKLCLLIFDEEAKMRRAVSGFVKGVWEEGVEERLVGKKPSAKEKKKAGVKVLAMLLVKWGKALDSGIREDEEEEEAADDTSTSEATGPLKKAKGKAVAALIASKPVGRTALAVEALWDEVEPVSDWETLLETLLSDHSAVDGEEGAPSSRNNRKKASNDAVDEAWRLEEVEEGVLLEVFLACLRRMRLEAAAAKKGEGESIVADITRDLIKALPRLFIKFQTDESRMANVLLLPQMMNLDEYLEMRMMTAYATLWDDITKQFLTHSSPVVLTNAVSTIRHMLEATSLSNSNSEKIVELEEELSTSLREAISGRDELELASFTEDEVLALSAICARIAALAGTRNMVSWMEEDEGGKQSSAWDIILALAERGRLGYREEEVMIDYALQVLYLHILWKARELKVVEEPTPDEVKFREKLQEQRDALLEKLLEFAVGTQSNTAEGVRRAAFQNLMHIEILFCPPRGEGLNSPPTTLLALTMDDETQYRCAGFVQAEIERYAEELEELAPDEEEDEDEDDDEDANNSDHDEAANTKKAKGKKGKRSPHLVVGGKSSVSQLEREYVFIGIITTFLRAIKAGAIHFRHSATLLAHYGRLGPVFDMCSKLIVDILREEGMYNDNGETVVAVILQALRESFMLFLDGIARSEDHTISLAKLLSSCFIIRGAQLSVVRRLDPKFVVEVHTRALNWLGKQLAIFEAAKNKKARNKCLAFFKVLAPLCTGVDTKDASKIKAHLDQVLAQANAEVLPTSKTWDGYRAYEKRLVTAKEKGATGTRPRKTKSGKTGDGATTDEDIGEASDAAPEREPEQPAPKPKPRPRRKQPSRSKAAATGTDTENAPEEDEPAEPEATPKQTRTRKQTEQDTPTSQRDPIVATPRASTRNSSPFVFATPGTGKRKRTRSPEDDDEDRRSASSKLTDLEDEEGKSSGTREGTPKSPESHTSEIQIRRKRVRH
ncbi:hypothetical protein K474DRAFT_1765478 [Panus rudis PR-1116 ss-1]|nr:hypothetical protein K474DRAFT_1765478 [Panus rudis PR-1116 ss-1]